VTILERSCHPNITRLLAATKQDEEALIITEFLDLGSLDRCLAFVVPMRPIQKKIFIYSVFAQIMFGLTYLHKYLHVAAHKIDETHIFLNSKGRVAIGSFGPIASGGSESRKKLADDLIDVGLMLERVCKKLNCLEAIDLLESWTNMGTNAGNLLRSPMLDSYYNESSIVSSQVLLSRNWNVVNAEDLCRSAADAINRLDDVINDATKLESARADKRAERRQLRFALKSNSTSKIGPAIDKLVDITRSIPPLYEVPLWLTY
jgi:hypothetical protein